MKYERKGRGHSDTFEVLVEYKERFILHKTLFRRWGHRTRVDISWGSSFFGTEVETRLSTAFMASACWHNRAYLCNLALVDESRPMPPKTHKHEDLNPGLPDNGLTTDDNLGRKTVASISSEDAGASGR